MTHPIETHIEKEHFLRMRALLGDKKFGTVLDLGCGDGTLTSLFQDCAEKIIAFDRLEHQITNAQKLYPNIDFRLVDLEKFVFSGENDLVIFCDVIYYLKPETQRRVMMNIFSTLSDDGYLLTSRHMGGGNAEFDSYNTLFEPIKSEWVPCAGNPHKWYITLWKKKNGVFRDLNLIQEQLWDVLLRERIDFPLLGLLFYASKFRNQNIFINLVNQYLKDKNNLNTPYFLTMSWLLELEKTDDWTNFQEMFHASVEGALVTDFRAPIMLEWMGKGKKVLDVGVHNGIHTNEYAKENLVMGIDLPKIVTRFRDLYKFECKVGDINNDLKHFEDSSFDVVVAGEIIEHLVNPKLVLDEVHRLLKPEGLLLISCPYQKVGPSDPLHCNYVNEEWLNKTFDGKFRIEEVKENLKQEKGCLLVKCRKLG